MGNYEPWTQKEIQTYEEIRVRNQGLGLLYALEGISPSEPPKVAEYLSNRLKLTASDHEAIMGIAHNKGRPEALRMLEKIAVKEFSLEA